MAMFSVGALALSACRAGSAADAATPPSAIASVGGEATTSPPPPLADATSTSAEAPPVPTRPSASPSVPVATTGVQASALAAAIDTLAPDNPAVSVTVLRDGTALFSRSTGVAASGRPVSAATPMVIASVSKLITALTVSRLIQAGDIALTSPVPWAEMSIAHDPAWDDVVVGELLTHTSGMPVARRTWFDDPGSCAVPLLDALAQPPSPKRGTWVYSNGNYCALGLMIEALTGRDIAAAADALVFTPLGIDGPHLITDPDAGSDGPYAPGVARLERLGGAGAWLASSADIATMLAAVTATDRAALSWPGVIVDQYGWGHTGTVDGAKACAWVMEDGRTVVVAIVAGNEPSTGAKVCDAVVPALATDLGAWAGEPVRSPV